MARRLLQAKSATFFRAAGDSDKARETLANAAPAREAAKRALREGADLYKMAADHFDSVNNIDKKITVIKKSARNIERLLEIK